MNQQSTLISDQPMKVLNSTLSARLTQVNPAIRALSAKGYTVVNQDLRLGDEKRRPLLTLAKGSEALRDTLKHVMNGANEHGRCVMGRFLDVDVCWPIEAH